MSVTLDQVSDKELASYASLIYDRTGITVSPQKKTLLSNRVRRRLRATGIEDFSSYHSHLSKLPADAPEWDAFLQEITTHETYLFRDEGQWNWFSQEFLPWLESSERAGKRDKTLRIWSAASSTGDEAYTIATCVAAHLRGHANWNIEIVGTDIGVGAIEVARRAVFGERAMRLVPDNLKRRYFKECKESVTWKAKDSLTQWVNFYQHNLLKPLKEKPFDLVFLKNVLIYFDTQSKTQVMGHVERALCPGGMLVTAAAEGISDLVNNMSKSKPWLHQKPSTK